MPNVIKVKANKYIWQSENALILKLLGLLSVKYSLTPQLCVREQSFCDYHYSFVLSYANIAKKNLHLEHFNHDMPMLRLVWFFPQTLN